LARLMLFNIRSMWIYVHQVHAERRHINFMSIEAVEPKKVRNCS